MWDLGDPHYGKASRLDACPSSEPYRTIPEPTKPKTKQEDNSQSRTLSATPPLSVCAACIGRGEAEEEEEEEEQEQQEEVAETIHYPITTGHHETLPSRTSTSASAYSSVTNFTGQVTRQQMCWERVAFPDTEPQQRLQPSCPLSTLPAHSLLPHHPGLLQSSSSRRIEAERKNSVHEIEVNIEVPSICTLWLLLNSTSSLAEVCSLVERYVMELYRTAVRVEKLLELTANQIDLPLSCLLGQLPSFKRGGRTQMFLLVEYTILTWSSPRIYPTTASSPPNGLLYRYHRLPDNNSTIPIKHIHPSTPYQCLPEYYGSCFQHYPDNDVPGSDSSPPFGDSAVYRMDSFGSSFGHQPQELPIYRHQQQRQSGRVEAKGYAGRRKRTNGECMYLEQATEILIEPAEKKTGHQRSDAKTPRTSGWTAANEDDGNAKNSRFRTLSAAPTPSLNQYRLKVVDAVPQNVTQNKEFCFSTCITGDGPDLEQAFQDIGNHQSSEERKPLTNLSSPKRITGEEERCTLVLEKGEGEMRKSTVDCPLQLTVWEEESKEQVTSKDVAIRSFIMDAKNRTVVFFVKIKKNSYYGRKRYILRIEGKGILLNQVEPFESAPFVVSAKNKAHVTRRRSASDPSLRPLLRVSPSTGQTLLPPNPSSTLSPPSFASISLSLPEPPAEDFPYF
ncbi:hypothetical protein QOT17_022954 [Balamuthia mandrillaris]